MRATGYLASMLLIGLLQGGEGPGAPDPEGSRPEPGGHPAQIPRRRGRRWLKVVGAGLVVAVVAALGFLYLQTESDLDDAEAALAEAQAELDRTTTALEASRQSVGDFQGRLTRTEASLAESEAALSNAETAFGRASDDLANSEGRLSQAETELIRVQDDLAEADARLLEADREHQGIIDFLSTAFSFGAGMTESDGICIAEVLVDELGVSELLDAIMGVAENPEMTSPEALTVGLAFIGAAEECGISMDAFGAQPGYGYGDNPQLDAFYDQCAAGSGFACDQLYNQSEVGSEYELFGGTCGYRFPSLFDAPASCIGEI